MVPGGRAERRAAFESGRREEGAMRDVRRVVLASAAAAPAIGWASVGSPEEVRPELRSPADRSGR